MSTLSLLSRGNAQVIKTTQERIEIRYEPQDYFNWRSHHDFQLRRFLNGKCASHNYWEIPTHKTYSTKKGPLVLYSEDLALPAWNLSQDKHGHRSHRYKRKKFKIELSTLLDLSGAILSYGRKQNGHINSNWQPYLHFLNEEDIQYARQIRPGYSPKRYLTRLLHTWDPNYLHKLQQAGSLRDSVQLQQLASCLGENSGRHPDLSSTPLKYQRLPAFTYLPQWTNTNAFTSSGHCTPVEEETGNEEELGADSGILEVNGKNSTVPLSGTGTFRRSSPERTKSHATQSSWKTKEQYNSHMQGETKYSQINEDDTTSSRTDYYEKPPVPLEVSFGKDNSSLSHQKSHTTFYGGPFTGRRKYPYGKQEPMRLYNENMEHLPEGSFLPPISQPVGPESEVTKDNKEPLKLPPIIEEPSRFPQRKRRRKAADPPKELLVIPLLVRFENQKVTQAEKTNTDGSTKAVPVNNDEDYMSNKLQSQEPYKEEPADSTLVKEIPTAGAESKLKTLQMDIDWNIDPNLDGDFLSMPDAPPKGLLPPINGKKGPGNQSSMANLKATSGTNNSTLSSKGQSLPTGIIRGSLPEELKECCKGGSVGSLIMNPNGEIVCLSLMGATRDTDIPIRFDFIPEEDVEDCLPVESAGQEEQWSGSQRDSEKEMDGSDSSSLQIPTNLVGRTSSPKHSNEPSKHKAKNRQRKISAPQTDIQEDANDVSAQQSVTEEIHEKTNENREESKGNKKEVQIDEKIESNTGTRREFGNLEARSTDTSATLSSQEILNNNAAFILQDIDAVIEESDLQNNGAINQSLRLVQISTDATARYTPVKEAAEVSSEQPIKTKDTISNKTPHTKSDTNATLTLEKVKATNERPSTGKSTLKKQEENIHNAEAPVPPTVQDEHSIEQEPNIKGTGKQTNAITKDSNISKENTPKQSKKSRKIPEINKDVEREANENNEKLPGLHLQAEVTQQKSPQGKQETTEEEEMALLQEITNTVNKETVKGKGKKKSKPEKAQKTEKSQAKATKKSKQGSATEGKAAFVVGQPKEKRAESKMSYPKKSSGTRQQTIQETQEIPHDMSEEEENDSEKESEDSYEVTEHVKRSPSPTEPKDLPPDSDTGTTDNIPNQDAEQMAPKPTFTTLPVTNPTNEVEYANSESSEATSSSVHQQKLARTQDRSEKAERRRLEVERKRREREEQLRLEKEQQERMERMREELEAEQQRRAEEIRIQKKLEEEERKRQEQERVRRMQLEQQALERARLQQEEYRRKLQEIQRRKQQEEMERLALERQRQQEQERLDAEERMRLLEMAAEEREEYQRKKREREEQARQEAERQRLMAEAEARALMEEAQRQAQLLARHTAALEKQLQFNRGLMKESVGMDQTQGVSRPWVFSYFEFLELLGLPLPVEGEAV